MSLTSEQLHRVFSPANTITIVGEKGAGKSNFCCVLMELLVQLGYEIWTNIHFFGWEKIGEACNEGMLKKGIPYRKLPGEVHVFSTLSELMYGLCEPGKKIVFLDEAGIVAKSGTTKKTTVIKLLTLIIRHFNTCIVNIAPLKTNLPPDLRDRLVDFEFNAYRERRRVTIGRRATKENDLGETFIAFPVVDEWWGTPHTLLAHDSYFISDLVPDIPLVELLEQLGKAESSLDVISGYGREVIDSLMKPNAPKATKKDRVIDKIKLYPEMSDIDISVICDCTDRYVRMVRKEMKKEILRIF